MKVSSLLNMVNQGAQAGSGTQDSATIAAAQKIDPANPPATPNALPVDIYHGSAGSVSTGTIGQSGVSAYINVTKVTDRVGLVDQWFAQAFHGMAQPSGVLRSDYETALSRLSPELQQKDWGFSVKNGQLTFTQGKDELSAQDRVALKNAFAGTNAAEAATGVETATVALDALQGQLGYGSHDLTSDNFGDVIDLRSYLTSHAPGGKYYDPHQIDQADYSFMYALTGFDAMLDQLNGKAGASGHG